MKKYFLIASLFFSLSMFSQDMANFRLYKPFENAEVAIADAVKSAKEQGKHVFIQIGGSWCVWCARFEDYVKSSKSLDSLVNANYVVYHMNYSKENQNEKLLEKYGFPQRFGFPVFLILDGNGKLIHTQNSAYLEAGKSYDFRKVQEFFMHWTRKALDPSEYKAPS